jgi:hypothetical protein
LTINENLKIGVNMQEPTEERQVYLGEYIDASILYQECNLESFVQMHERKGLTLQ